MNKSCTFLTLLTVAFLGLPGLALAQTGTIEGQVTHDDGTAMGGVTVLINELGEVTLSDPNGVFGFAEVPAGTYTLSFTLSDNSATLENVEVLGGDTTNADIGVDWVVSFADTITVVSASRRMERIVDAPAAVSIVTAIEIQRQASHGQAPKLIEFTPGAEVTQSGIYDFNINTRGFNSSLTRRVATLIDGRDPSVPFLGAQEWAAVSYPLDDFSVIEMVRGPSAALYGANASAGVLNMITKRPRDYEGGLVRLTGGELSTFNADLRWAGSLGEGWYFKVVGGIRDHDDWFVSRMGAAEYSEPCPVPQGGATDCLPQEAVSPDPESDEISFYGLRIDKYIGEQSFFTLEGGDANVEGPLFQTGIGRVQLVDVSRPWVRFNYFHPRFNVLASQSTRDAPMQTSMASGLNLALDTENVSLEAQGNWEFGDSRLVVGASYSEDDIDSKDPRTGRQTLMFEPVTAEFTALFGQFDWDLGDSVRLVLAGRYDDGDLFDGQFSPKVALVWSVNRDHTLRFTFNQAFQVANYSEFFLQANVALPVDLSGLNAAVCLAQGFDCGLGLTPVLALGNATLDLEEIQTVEVGWNAILGPKTFLTADVYFSESDKFITDLLPQLGTTLGRVNPNFGPWQAPDSVPGPAKPAVEAIVLSQVPALSNNVDESAIIGAVSYTNFGEVESSGFDLSLTSQVSNQWTVQFGYSYNDFEIKQDLPGFENLLVPNTPEHKLVGGVAFVTERWNASFDGRWVDEFRWAVGPFVGPVLSYTTFDLAAEYGISEAVGLGLVITNMFDDDHYQSFGGDLLGRRALGTITFGW